MARCYSALDLQHVLIPRIMEEKIAKYQDSVTIGKINRHGGLVVETDA